MVLVIVMVCELVFSGEIRSGIDPKEVYIYNRPLGLKIREDMETSLPVQFCSW